MDKWDIPSFKFKLMPPNEVRDEWVRYKRQFEYLSLANNVTNKTRLKNIFLAKAGPDVQDVFSSLPGADVEERLGVDPFKVAMEKLDEYFAPKQHDAYQRFLFWTLKLKDEEPLDKFLLRAMESAGKCNFGNTRQEAYEICVIDKLIQLAPSDLREKLLQKETLVLDEVIKIVNSHGTVKLQASQMTVSSYGPSTSSQASGAVNRIGNFPRDSRFNCSRCGRRGHSGKDPVCPARTRSCRICQKLGHFAECCRSSRGTAKRETRDESNFDHKRVKYQHVRAIQNTDDEGKPYSFIFTVGDGDEFLWVKIGGVLIQTLIDSGSQKNILDDVTWEKMMAQGAKVENVRSVSDQTFRAYGRSSDPLVVKHVFESRIEVNEGQTPISTLATFYVIEGGSQALLGRATAKEMGVLTLGLPSTESPNVYRIRSERKHPFPKVKGIKLIIPIDTTVTPVCQHVRRPPLALMDKIEEKLDSLLASDIIERVDEYSAWVSPLVTIVKDNGDLRLCVDMRRANLAINRETHFMPTFEDFLPQLKKAKYFSRLDIKEAFHQVELEESSRHITTFITHKGLFRYKRLMFGISCAPEMFQKVLEQILSGCKNVVSFIDDCLIFGETLEEHDQALAKVLQTLREKNVLLNHDKCVFRVQEIDFLGHHLSGNGIRPTDDKLAALKSFRAPQTAEELRSFLGLVTYVGRFLPDLATVCDPLRLLTHTGVPFTWGNEHEAAFRRLQSMISDISTLHYFDNSLRTRVIADASPVGLGAVLVQFGNDRDDSRPRVISYASKSLSPTERRYCQTEKEALALVWAVERFSIYLLGRKFELETDHKPLETIFSPSSRPCARIERWVLRLQSFTFVVRYRKGSSNVADPFSRLATDCTNQDFDSDSPYLVLAIMESAAIDTCELEHASTEDYELSIVRECVRSGKWDKPEAKPFEVFRNELGFVGDLLVRGSKLVVPKSLRARMLILAHEGHPGETVMKRRLRNRVWWPNMDREASSHVAACEGCRLVGLPSKPEPMQRRELPVKPWIDVALDFLGPLPTGEYLLVVIDYYSRYKEIEIMRHITANETITRLHKIFTRLGFPVTLTLDNARQFISATFDNYCAQNGIHLNYSTPYWPQENGLVERQNRSLLKRLQISHALGRDWKSDLQEYLLMYYTSPHSVTGKTPTELCYGRTIRSKIPSLSDVEVAPSRDEVADRDRFLKEKGKEEEDGKRHAVNSNLEVGDTVLMKNLLPANKLSTTFNPNEYLVVNKEGSRVTIQDKTSDKSYRRNVAHLKRIDDYNEASSSRQETVALSEHQEPVNPELSPPIDQANSSRLNHSEHSRTRRQLKVPLRFKDYKC
ncbi:uncharacterized protein K02A2.6-like isoform X2 [Aedes albopictus]